MRTAPKQPNEIYAPAHIYPNRHYPFSSASSDYARKVGRCFESVSAGGRIVIHWAGRIAEGCSSQTPHRGRKLSDGPTYIHTIAPLRTVPRTGKGRIRRAESGISDRPGRRPRPPSANGPPPSRPARPAPRIRTPSQRFRAVRPPFERSHAPSRRSAHPIRSSPP